MDWGFKVKMIIRGKIPGTESLMDVRVENGKVIRVSAYAKGSCYDFGGDDLYLCSGFFDPQVNGFAGVDFNSPSLSAETLHRAALSLASTGVTRFLPTLITSSHEKTVRQLEIIGDALKNDPLLGKCVSESTSKDLTFLLKMDPEGLTFESSYGSLDGKKWKGFRKRVKAGSDASL